jgi:cGMP-dependent protein kinase
MSEALPDIGFMSEEISRFYISTLILCVEYLHNLKIIHRNINPINMWIA